MAKTGDASALFAYKDQATSPGQHMGFLAEDVAKVAPSLVVDDDKGKPLKVKYLEMTALLVKAVQELKADNDNLRASIRKLRYPKRQ